MKYKITSADGESLIIDTERPFEEIRKEIDTKESTFVLLQLNGKDCYMGIDFLRQSYVVEVVESERIGFALPNF
jgi:hypothetical protein